MKKIVLVSDSPYATTGLGRMSKYFLKMFPEYEWVVWGIMHPTFYVDKGKFYPTYNKEDFKAKFRILCPRMFTDDQFGYDIVPTIIEQEKPDIVITSMDFDRALKMNDEIKKLQMINPFKWISYFPMDREDYKSLEVDGFRYPNVNVCITKFGQNKIKEIDPKIKIEQIYHPLDLEEFPKLSKKEINTFQVNTWKNTDKNTFIAGTVNRSSARKDSARLVKIFSEFLKKTENTNAYVHGANRTFEGVNLMDVAYENETPMQRLSFLPKGFLEFSGVSQSDLNKLYSAMDLFVTVSTGEGYGFSTVEAMLKEIPIIAPRNTSFPELVQDFGYLIDPSEMAFQYNSTTTMWPIVNVDEVVNKMLYVKDNYAEAKEKAKEGAKWVRENLNLDIIAKQWKAILEK